MANVDLPNSIPPINTVPAGFPDTPQPGKIESLYIANNRSIIDRFSPKTGYSNSLLKFGPRQPFVWYNPNEGNGGLNAVRKYDSRAFPIGSTLQDVIRISKFSVSGPGVIFSLKQFLLQNLQPYNETALYNPLMPIVGAARPGSLGLLPRPTRHIDLGGGLLGALASVVGFSVGDNSQSSPKGTVGAGKNDTSDESPLSKQSAGGGKGLLRAKSASSGYTSLASRWGGNASKGSFLRSMAASVFPSLINVKQPEGTGYKGDEGAYGMMIGDLRGKFKKHNPVTGVEIPITQIWIAGSSEGGPYNIRKKNEAPQDRKLIYVDGTEQKINSTTVDGPSINNSPTGFSFEKDIDNVEKYGKSVGMIPSRLHPDDVFKYSIMLINYKKYIEKTLMFPTKMDGPPVDLTNADDKTIVQPQSDFYKKYGFGETPTIFIYKTQTSIPTRMGSGDPKRAAYQVDRTYSKQRKDDGGNGNLSNFKQNLEDDKIQDVPSSMNDIGDKINATLQQKQDDPIVKSLVDDRKKVFTNLGLSDTPNISKVKTIADIPARGTSAVGESAYKVDGTYSKLRKDAIDGGSPNGSLSDIRQTMEDGKFQSISTETTDLRSNDVDQINATLQLDANDRINKERVESLRLLVNNIKNSGYSVEFANADTKVFSSPDATKFGIDLISKGHSVYEDDYFFNKQLLDGLDRGGKRSKNHKKFAGSHMGDEINKLTILDKDKNITDETDVDDWKIYDPYADDLIAFYFYDMVNEKHIPFRASITGINDSFQAEWTGYEYIGRPDKLYTYKGFGRTLSFSFRVIANSIKELLPMWKRVNYLCGLTMPANYTQASRQDNISQNQFIVPPFVLLTIGDMYKEQPILINRVGLNIPDGTSWETLNETHGEDWSYLNNIITWTGSQGKFAQFPREVEVSLDLAVLQKERAVTGSANFGHAPRDINNQAVIAGGNNPFSTNLLVPIKSLE